MALGRGGQGRELGVGGCFAAEGQERDSLREAAAPQGVERLLPGPAAPEQPDEDHVDGLQVGPRHRIEVGGIGRPDGREVGRESLDDRAQRQDLRVGVGEDQDHRIIASTAPRSTWASSTSAMRSICDSRAAAKLTPEGAAALASSLGDLAEEGAPEPVLLEQPVQAGALHGAVIGGGTVAAMAVGVVEGDPAIGLGPGCAAVMDLVAGDALTAGMAPALAGHLGGLEKGGDGKPVEPCHRVGAHRLDRVVDRPAQHLVAAANAEDRRSPRPCLVQRFGKAPAPQPLQVGNRGLRSRQDDEVGIAEARRGVRSGAPRLRAR